jgi:hypothetical protein
MSIRGLPFIWFQLAFAGAVVLVLLVGDRSQPRVLSVPDHLLVNQPVIITFDRPVKQQGSSQDVQLINRQTGQATPGSLSWSSRSIAFIPTQPLAYGATYALKVSGVDDLEGHPMRSPHVSGLSTSRPRFLYVSPDYRLESYDLDSKESRQLSKSGQQVMGYSVSADGSQVVLSYLTGSTPDYTFGLEHLSLAADGTPGEVKSVYYGKGKAFLVVRICDGGSQALAYEDQFDGKGGLAAEEIESYPLSSDGQFGTPAVLVGKDQLVGEILDCSPINDQFLYLDGTGSLTLSSVFDASQKEALGRYSFTYGFAPKDGSVLIGDQSPAVPSPSIVYSVGTDGVRRQLSQPGVSTVGPAYDPAQATLVVAEDADGASLREIYGHFQIVLYQKQPGLGTLRKVLTSYEEEWTNQGAAWSADGCYLTYQHVATGDVAGAGVRPQDTQGNYLDGDIMLTAFDPSKPFLLDQTTPQKPGIKGFNVQWLP